MNNLYRYFPVNAAQKEWGIYATCAGRNRTEPGATFPSRAHPDEYYFSWDVGRILHEWQMFLIVHGEGVVEFKGRKFHVREGSLTILPPECWHRYRPNAKTGWSTIWIGFGGDLAARLVGGARFDPEGEVRNLSHRHRFQRLFADTVSDVLENGHTTVYAAAARIPALVAALIDDGPSDDASAANAEIVRRAQTFIAEHSSGVVDFESLASSLGVTYRTFRYLFTKETGVAPLQYQLGVRLARAKNLLRSSDMSIAEIADTLGFHSTWYFSHFFKKHAKTSAATYRRRFGT